MPTEHRKSVQLSGSNLNIAYSDSGHGETLLLIHGVGMQSAAWAPQVDCFRENYRVIALDMPGHGGSDALQPGSELPDYVDWARLSIELLELAPVNVAGHSMGALIAGGLAATSPNLIKRVALLSGVFERDDAAAMAVKKRAEQIHNGKIDIETPLTRWFDANETHARDQVANWLSSVDPTGYATAYSAFASGDSTYAKRFCDINCPFLALTGEDDPNSTPAMTQLMAKRVSGGQAITIKGHKHMVNLTAANDVNAHLQTWLERTVQNEGS